MSFRCTSLLDSFIAPKWNWCNLLVLVMTFVSSLRLSLKRFCHGNRLRRFCILDETPYQSICSILSLRWQESFFYPFSVSMVAALCAAAIVIVIIGLAGFPLMAKIMDRLGLS